MNVSAIRALLPLSVDSFVMMGLVAVSDICDLCMIDFFS